MPGMLEQGMAPQQPAPQPSSGPPVAQTPPSPPPQGDVGGAPGPGHMPPEAPQASPQAAPQEQAPQEEFEKMRDQAIKLVYGDRFDQLIEMFRTNGPEKFARSMAVAVNTPINVLEKEGPIDPVTATKIGMAIYMRLLEDMIGGGVVEGVTAKQVEETLPAILMMYADSHPGVSKEDIQKVVMNSQKGVLKNEAPTETGDPAAGIMPGSGGAA